MGGSGEEVGGRADEVGGQVGLCLVLCPLGR